MTTPPTGNLPTAPTIPLSDDLRAAYVDLLDKLESQRQGTADPAVLGAIDPVKLNVSNLLTKDDEYKFNQDSALFAALETQFNATNAGLQTLQTQIQSTASHFAMGGQILAAITKVFTFLS